jgi:LIVCS family branched-chain amino acid:cation transporter
MIKASVLAAGLLSLMYVGLTYLAAYYTPHLDPSHTKEERLSSIAVYLLGPQGALVAGVAVAMICLTTAVAISSIFSSYLHEDFLKKRGSMLWPLLITLGSSCLIANLGFMGIAAMLSPVLEILCPGLILLSSINVVDKLYERQISRLPVFATFAMSTIGHVIRLAA